MAGLAAAWRLSEAGWEGRFDSITLYQRGARLGGKGASSRGPNGRIEEHGLHVWLGHYDNAFALIRSCYGELDRERLDPRAPIRTWTDAFTPASKVGMEDAHHGAWRAWIGDFATNDLVPGDPEGAMHTLGPAELLRRVGRLLGDLVESFDPAERTAELTLQPHPPRRRPSPASVAVLATGALLEMAGLAATAAGERIQAETLAALDLALDEARTLLSAIGTDDSMRRTWHLVAVVAAVARGIIADGVLTHPQGFRILNDEDFRDWIRRHGAPEEAVDSTFVRGLYDLVFAHVDGDPRREAFAAGTGAFLSTKTLLDYKGAIFWKMAAGMGEVVIAPLYQALRARGVRFEFFHRVDDLHVDANGEAIEAITLGRQVRLAPGRREYDPLVRFDGLPCFPDAPILEQLDCDPGVLDHELEAAWCDWPDAEERVLRRGDDFDLVVFALPPPMAKLVATELIDRRAPWRAMADGIATVATQALQLWLREDDVTLGWSQPGTTVTGFVDGFDTWASMPHLIDREGWPTDDRPRTIAYFCNTLASELPIVPTPAWARAEHERVRAIAERFCRDDLAHLLPGAFDDGSFRWDLLSGAGPGSGPDALATQYWRANVDPSDRYVQAAPATDHLRLRPDESGFTNLVLAGDWTDNGCNAGCIEAAVLSGLQAANALLGRHRWHRILGAWMP